MLKVMENKSSDQLKDNFEYCFNLLINNSYIKAYNLFLENYLKFPAYNNYLLGVIISLILSTPYCRCSLVSFTKSINGIISFVGNFRNLRIPPISGR